MQFPGVVPATMIRNQPQQIPQGESASILLFAIPLTPVPGTGGGNFRQPMAGPPMATQTNHPGTYSSQTQDRGVRSLYCCCPWGLNGSCCDSTAFMPTRNQQGQAGNMSLGSVGVGRGPSPAYGYGYGTGTGTGVSLFGNTQALSVLSKTHLVHTSWFGANHKGS